MKDQVLTLHGETISLRLLQESDRKALYAIAQDKRIWRMMSRLDDASKFMTDWFDVAMKQNKQGTAMRFAVIYQGVVVGSVGMVDIDYRHKRLMIGDTWLDASVWGKGISGEAWRLMLDYTFNTMQFNRINIMADPDNTQSNRAIEKIGAIKEGVLRGYVMKPEGPRDRILYSILQSDYVKPQLSVVVSA